jgi:hypothetical protein
MIRRGRKEANAMVEGMTRREFGARAMGSMALLALMDTLLGKDVFASPLRPWASRWLAELDQLGRDVKAQKLKQVEWQKKVEELFSKVDLPEFLKYIDFEALVRKGADYKGPGAKSLMVNFPQAEGVPAKLVFGRQIFALKKDRSIVPHGHNNMATCFLVLQGRLHGRHYDRLETQARHLIVKPTIDQEFGPGGTSSISDVKDNVHWFKAMTDSAFVFNIHVLGVTPGNTEPTGRVYVDPNGEKLEGGSIRARLIDHDEADRLYG